MKELAPENIHSIFVTLDTFQISSAGGANNMRNVMAIEPKWLVELAPRFFKRADAGQLSTAKRRQKIEPLYDRFNPEGSWRLSKRRG